MRGKIGEWESGSRRSEVKETSFSDGEKGKIVKMRIT